MLDARQLVHSNTPVWGRVYTLLNPYRKEKLGNIKPHAWSGTANPIVQTHNSYKEEVVKRSTRFLTAVPLALILLVLVVMPALACHNIIWADADCFEGYDIGARYYGGSQHRRVTWDVYLTVDGSTEHIQGEWEGKHSGFEIFRRTGPPADVTVTGTVKMYKQVVSWGPWNWGYNSNADQNKYRNGEFGWGWYHRFKVYEWQLIETDTFNFGFVDQCYETCDEVTDWIEVSRSEWTFNPDTGLFEQVVTYEAYDAHDGETLCDTKQEVETREPATINVSVGACSWSEETGSQTPVSIDINGNATVTIQGPGGPYTVNSDTSLNLPPGSYSWSASAGEGYMILGADSGEFTVEDCTPLPASVEVQLGVCQWTQQTGSITPVSFTIDHATVTVSGPGGPYVLTSSTTLALSPGSYSYSWEATEGYQGSGEGSFTVPDCSQTPTSVEVSVGSCEWNGEESTTIVSFTLGEGVSVLLAGEAGVATIEESASFALPPGYYYWAAVVEDGYYIVGASEGEFAVASCEPGVASVAVTFGVCEFDEETSITEVTFTLSGDVTVTLTGPDGFEMELTETTSIELPDGHYEWTAEAGEGYELEGEDSGEFDLNKCEPPCETCDCPTCDAPIRETMGQSMGIAWFSDVPCTAENCVLWYQEHNPWVKLWTMIKSFFTHEGETVSLQEIVNANGGICYVQYFRDGQTIGDFILWGPDGEGDRFRDHVPDSERALHKYSACSIFPSWCDTRLVDGQEYAVWLPGHTVADWAQFLLDNGFYPDAEHRGTAALVWAYTLRANGRRALLNWDGDLDSLPLHPLPPR